MANNRHPSESGIGHRIALVILGVALASLPQTLHGQQAPPKKAPVQKAPANTATTPAPAPARPQYKGIWEPVNYKEDLQLTDVFFVSADVGWVSGAAGTILKTTDGGQTWTAQLGGDPHSQEGGVWGLDFVDETHGWARMTYKLLRTTDGETWEQIGRLPGDNYGYYVFTSQTNGTYTYGPEIFQTVNAGKTWKEVFTCRTKLEVAGLMREDSCYSLSSVHFPSPTVGYAVSAEHAVPGVFALTKTEDGGATWSVTAVRDAGSAEEVFFTDESTGFVRIYGGNVYKTTDGGQTWSGIAASVGARIKFADPEVGWSIYGRYFSYTTDGGKHWFSRQIPFPVEPNAFSLPRRDRGYVVGSRGMIYRYRVVPATEQVAKAIPAPAMPLLDSPLDEQVGQLDAQVKALEQEVQAAQAAENPPAAGENKPPAEEAGSESQQGWVEQKFSDQVQQIQASVDGVAAEVPKFTGKYRNLNLIFGGIQLIGQLFGQTQSLKDSFQALRKARDPQAVTAALTQLSGQVTGLVQNTKTAFQRPQ